MLRDYGIGYNSKFVSRRLEKRDVEKFEFVLGMVLSLLWRSLLKDLT